MKFKRQGTLAIHPKAIGFDFLFADKPQSGPKMLGDTAVVEIRGPMIHHDEWWWESYDAIVQRVTAAFASPARRVLISGDTPGGELSGLFDTARELRRIADAAGKPFAWYVDGDTCSAGIALACATDRIFVPEEGRIGSIGVIAELWNSTEAAANWGEKCVLITSGARKADGHPMAPITDETIAAIQQSVNEEAALFFAWVAQRRNLAVPEIEGWQAAVFHGQQGVALGLADSVATFTGALSMVEGVTTSEASSGAEQGTKTMAGKKLEEARKLLGEVAAEESEDGEAARKMLGVKSEEEAPKDDKEKNDEEPDGDEGEDEGGGDEASATAEDEGSGDEARLAEDESKKAKKAEDEAAAAEDESKKAEDEVDQALAHGDSKAALAARKRSKAARARKTSALMRASVFRSNARVHLSLAKAAAKPAPAPKPQATTKGKLSSALGANAARGTRGETQTGSAAPGESEGTISLADVSPEDRRAAGLDRSNSFVAVRRDHEGLTVDQGMSPAQAKALMGKLESEMARVSQ